MKQLLHELGVGLRHLLYPGVCFVCRKALAEEQRDFCPGCIAELTTDAHVVCPRCAASVGPWSDLSEGCIHCREEKFHFEQAVRLGKYEAKLRDMILRMKTSEATAEAIGEIWAGTKAAELKSLGATRLIPVPLHWLRQWQRGYNQSEVLVRAISRQTGIPWVQGLRRIRMTPSQARSGITERKQNLKGAIALARRYSPEGETILLVDDVMTTGTTLETCATVLKKAGAVKVIVAILARPV